VEDLAGNVAEWTVEPDGAMTARGGSYASRSAAELKSWASVMLEGADARVGFRCAYEVGAEPGAVDTRRVGAKGRPIMRAAVLCVGTELTTGEVGDAHGAWLAGELTGLGFEVGEITIVADGVAAVSAALTRLGMAYDCVVCTGGLGPTTDDVTAAAPRPHWGSGSGGTRSRWSGSGRSWPRGGSPVGVERQAGRSSVGARAVPNDNGTAPGFSLRVGRADAWFLPGVPQEMRAMLRRRSYPRCKGRPTTSGG
jgi:nicotinamide-nucleotide amidase